MGSFFCFGSSFFWKGEEQEENNPVDTQVGEEEVQRRAGAATTLSSVMSCLQPMEYFRPEPRNAPEKVYNSEGSPRWCGPRWGITAHRRNSQSLENFMDDSLCGRDDMLQRLRGVSPLRRKEQQEQHGMNLNFLQAPYPSPLCCWG